MATQQSRTELQAEIARLQAEAKLLQAKAKGTIEFRVSQKGAVSVYGLGRFPVTLYAQQWEKLLGMSNDLKTFMLVNAKDLTTK
jgi:ribosome-interacting GTPase 1